MKRPVAQHGYASVLGPDLFLNAACRSLACGCLQIHLAASCFRPTWASAKTLRFPTQLESTDLESQVAQNNMLK